MPLDTSPANVPTTVNIAQPIDTQQAKAQEQKPPEPTPVETKPVVSGYRYGNWVGNESGDFWQNTRTGERVWGDPYHFRENPRTEVLGTAKDVPRVSYTGSLTTGQAQDMPKGTPVAFGKGSTIEQKYTDTLIAQQEQAKAQEQKAAQIQKMLESPTAQFGSKEALQRGYDIASASNPFFTPEQVKATTISATQQQIQAEKEIMGRTQQDIDIAKLSREDTQKLVDVGVLQYKEPTPKEFKLGWEQPEIPSLFSSKTTEKLSISPETLSRMKGVELGKIDVGKQLEKIATAEEKLKSFEPLIKDGKFIGTNKEYVDYQKAQDKYEKENKVLGDIYKAREKESISTPLLKPASDLSKWLQGGADEILGVSKETTPGIRTAVSGAASVFTGLPEFAGQAVFSGEQIVRHPGELVDVAKVGTSLFVKGTKEAAIQDPFRFGGSLVGMVAMGKAGKVPEGIKNIKFEEASGIRSLRETIPTLEPSSKLADLTAAKEVLGDIKGNLLQPTSRMEALGVAKDVVGETKADISSKISKEISQPTIRGKSLESIKEVIGEQKQAISRELAKITPREQAIKDVQKLIGKEFEKPTRGTEAVKATQKLFGETKLGIIEELSQPTMREKALGTAKEVSTKIAKSIQESGRVKPEIKGLSPESAGVRYLFGREIFIPAEKIIEPQVISGAERFPLAPKGTTGKQLVKEFKTSKYRIPGTEEKIGGWHATPQEFAKKTEAQVGSSESPGMYIAPSTSPHFLKLTPSESKLFGLGNKPSHPAAIFLEVKDITRAPKNIRKNIAEYNKFLLEEAEKGKAFVSAAFEKGIKPEKEAIIPPETPIRRIKSEYATEWMGKKVPVMEYSVEKSSILEPSVKVKTETLGELTKRQSKAYSEYRGYKEPLITPSTLLSSSVIKIPIKTEKILVSPIGESRTKSQISRLEKSVVSSIRSPISSSIKSDIPSGIRSIISEKSSTTSPLEYKEPTIPIKSRPSNIENSIKYPRPYLDRYISEYFNNPTQPEIPRDEVFSYNMNKYGEKESKKVSKKVQYKYKSRESPIFEGAEKLFEDTPNSPLGTPRKAPERRKPIKHTKTPTFDLEGLGFRENPIKTNRIKSKKNNKKQFWET